jgi:hypothetical protein
MDESVAYLAAKSGAIFTIWRLMGLTIATFLIETEDPGEFNQVRGCYYTRFGPRDQVENDLVDKIVQPSGTKSAPGPWNTRPWVRAFREAMALPSGVVGPVDFWAFARLAFRRRMDTSFCGDDIKITPFNFRLLHDLFLTHFVDMGKSFVLWAKEFFILW